MANVLAPKGLLPVRRTDGAMPNFAYNHYQIASGYGTNIFWGDPVAFNTNGTITIAGTSATSQVRGIFQGVYYKDPTGTWQWSKNWVAGTTWAGSLVNTNPNCVAFVVDDPNVEFMAQFVNSTSVPVQADIGSCFNVNLGTGNTSIGTSGAGIDYTTATTTANQGQFRFLRFATQPTNDVTSANSWGIFAPNLHDFRVNTGV